MNRRTFLKTVSQTAALAAASRYLPQPADAAAGPLTLALLGDCSTRSRSISESRSMRGVFRSWPAVKRDVRSWRGSPGSRSRSARRSRSRTGSAGSGSVEEGFP